MQCQEYRNKESLIKTAIKTVKREGALKTIAKLQDSSDPMQKVHFLPKLVFTLKANC